MYQYVQYETDLVPWANTVSYQGDQGTCGPNMIYNAIGIVSNLMGQSFEVNKQALYNMYLIDSGVAGMDVGVNPQMFAQTLEQRGVSERTDINYGLSHINEVPSQATYTDAATHTLDLTRMTVDGQNQEQLIRILGQKLLEGKPLLLYYTVYSDFMGQHGPLTEQPGDNFASYAGGHAVAITGVDTANNMLTVASWGEQYGDHGYFHLSLDSFYAHKGGSSSNLWDVYEIDGFNGVDLDFNAHTEDAASAFVAILDRAPAKGGMAAFSGYMESGGTLVNLCDTILNSAEGQGIYAGVDNTHFVQSLFNNTMGRDALTGGLNFYLSQLSNGTSRGQVAADIITSGMDESHWTNGLFSGSDLGRYSDGLMFHNRVTAAQDYAITLQAEGGHNAVAAELLNEVTIDPGSIWGVALVGVREQLGYEHINGVVLS